MSKSYLRMKQVFCLIAICAFIGVQGVAAQTTAFSYQGRLNDGGAPANANYEMEFKLFDALAGGAQIGATFSDPSVTVINGFFSTELDFGAAAFDGTARWLEIGVRPVGGGAFTILPPRIAILSAPYAIQARNATQLGGLPASDYVTTTAGATNYVQNGTTPQVGANFNIDGNGRAGSLDVNGAVSLGGSLPPAPAPAGQGRIYFDAASNKVQVSEDGGAFVNLVGAGGVSGSGTVNSIPLWSDGTTLGNSLITQSGGTTVQLPALVSLAATASGNNITFGSPNSGTGMTISGPTTRADVRLDGTTLRLNVGQAGVGPPGNGIGIDSNGTVQLPSGVSLAATASGNNITFGSPNSETGMTISGPTGRADVRFDGSTLKLVAGPAGGPPGNGIVINTLGNVGIGIAPTPVKLFVQGGVDAFRAIGTGQGVYGQSTGGGSGVIGLSNTTSPTGGAVAAFNTAGGNAIYAAGDTYTSGNNFTTGNIRQNLSGFGLVKAMVQFRFDIAGGFIVRCYNGITGSSSGQCGFSFDNYDLGGLHTRLNLGFTVNNRFISATAFGVDLASVWGFSDSTTVDILTRNISGESSVHEFYLLIY